MNSLHKTFTWSMILIAVLSVGVVGYFWISQEYRKFNQEALKMRAAYVNGQKNLIKNEVDRVVAYVQYKRVTTEIELKKGIKERVYGAVSLAENIYKKYQGQKNDQEILSIIKEVLRSIRFNQGRGYFFVYDFDGNNILLPFSPQLEGKNLWDLKDQKGKYTIRRMTRVVASEGEGFLRWHWYKPGITDHMSEKIGFAKHFKPYNLWIGTGEYIEDFEKDIQKETLAWVNKIRFGKDGYIFVYDFNAITLAHYKQANLGIDRWDYKDANGIPVVRELIRISREKEGGGFLEYVGTIRPTTGEPAAKIGYGKSVMDWQWMVGAGIYVEEIEDMLAEQRAALKTKIRQDIFFILAILFISILVISLISRYIAGKTADNITAFSYFFGKTATDSTKIEDTTIHFSEFKQLAHSANQMVEERIKAEASLKELQARLNRSRKMEALGVLAGGVAHDLNNVLSGMVSYPDLILADLPADSRQRKFINAIKASGNKAADIVQDLLTLARRGVAQESVLNLNAIVEEYIGSPEHEKMMELHPNVAVRTALENELLNITGSPIHLQKTVMNLAFNAAEAQPEGGDIVISTENRYVDHPIKGYEKIDEGDYVVLKVEDRGIGIAQADLERIFEPFFTKKKLGYSGTGLGMAVVWGTVQDHKGYINVASAEGKGTIFELYFRATRESIVDEKNVEAIDHYTGDGQTILVVDDIQAQRDLAQAILTRLNYRTVTVPSGEEAVEYLKNHTVDLIVLDMIMAPGMDGYATYKQILAIHPNQKAVISSGYAETGRVKATMALGAGQYVKKPYTVDKIGMALRSELERT